MDIISKKWFYSKGRDEEVDEMYEIFDRRLGVTRLIMFKGTRTQWGCKKSKMCFPTTSISRSATLTSWNSSRMQIWITMGF